MPDIILTGRFWCEEGNVFFHNAWVMPPFQALFNSFGGYLNLAANAGTLAARWLLPVALAPYLTITLSLLVQLCPPLLLLQAQDAWLQPVCVRIAAVLLILFVPAVEEVWLHTLHCQFHLALCVGIILVLQAEPWRVSWFRYGLLFLAPLCGPGAIAFLPIYAVRAVVERDRARVCQLAALTLSSVLQLGLFYRHEHSRGYAFNPVILLDVFAIRHLYLPFLGIVWTDHLAPLVAARLHAGFVPKVATALPVLVFGPYLVLTLWRRQTRPAFWLLLAGGLIGCASYFGALGGAEGLIHARAGGRYIFVPQALFSLSILALAATSTGWARRGAWVVVAWLLVLGGAEYVQPWPFIAHGPSWRAEVAKWEADPSYRLHVWSADWTPVSLPVQSQR